MRVIPLRSSFAVLAAVIALGAAGTVLPADASAVPRVISPTKVGNWTVTEGSTVTLRIKLVCQRGYNPCTYQVNAVGLTARRPGDFVAKAPPARAKLKIRRPGRSMITTVTFTAVDDAICEGTEFARVRVVKRTRWRTLPPRIDYGTVAIRDNDCISRPIPAPTPPLTPMPPSPPSPPVPPAFPPDSGTPTVTTTPLSAGTMRECTTPHWIGTETAGPNQWFNSGCSIVVACPQSASVCSARSESRHTLERSISGERVSLNSRVSAFSASGVRYWFRDQSSSGVGVTRNEDPGVMIRGGESARLECNGVRISPTQPNRSRIGCSLSVERVS